MSLEVTLRRAALSDLEAVLELRLRFLAEFSNQTDPDAEQALRETVRCYLQEAMPSGEFVAWLAEVDSQAVGIVAAVFLRKPPAYHNITGIEAYILNVYTAPEQRGQGVAKALLRHLLDEIRTTEAQRISLHAAPGVRRLYESLGFTLRDGEMLFDCAHT